MKKEEAVTILRMTAEESIFNGKIKTIAQKRLDEAMLMAAHALEQKYDVEVEKEHMCESYVKLSFPYNREVPLPCDITLESESIMEPRAWNDSPRCLGHKFKICLNDLEKLDALIDRLKILSDMCHRREDNNG
jgi:hypothetical protein